MGKICKRCNASNPDDAKYCKECGYSLEETEEVTPSRKTPSDVTPTHKVFLGKRFEILELLGIGGMGKVYKAKDTELDEVIAIKLLSDELSSDEKMIEYFKREIRLARKVKHKNIARVHDLQEFEGKRFITMEYVDGTTLKNLITKKGSFSLEEGLPIIKQVCEGLKACHDSGIIHRDISSKNIMIDKNGNALIMDFGIARSAVTGGTATVVGTPHYMSPEQLEGKKVDARSDIYSLGVVMYEMFTGSLPFTGTTPISIAMRHLKEKPVNPARLNRALPKKMCEIILKCLEKEKSKRYQSIEELLKDISEVEEIISTEVAPLPKRKTKINYLFPTTLVIIFLAVGGTFLLLKPTGEVKKPFKSGEGDQKSISEQKKEIKTQPMESKLSVSANLSETHEAETTQKIQEELKVEVEKPLTKKTEGKNLQPETQIIPQEKPKPPPTEKPKKIETEKERLIRMGLGIFSPSIPFKGTFILVDGEPVAQSPVSSLELPEGNHKIELKNYELNAYLEDEIYIIAGETLKKNYSFSQKGTIQVQAIPWAEVFIEGKNYGQTPIDRIELPVGYYEVVFKHPAFPEKRVKVTVRGEETTRVETVDMRK